MASYNKGLPYSKESEMMVLGCMLTNVAAFNIAANMLKDTDFHFMEHKTIFDILHKAYKTDTPVDVHLVAEALKRTGNLNEVGGVGYLMALAQYAGTSANIEEYAELVKNKSMLRQMVYASQTIEQSALQHPEDVCSALEYAQQLFFEIGKSVGTKAGMSIGDLISGKRGARTIPFMDALQKRQDRFLQVGLGGSAVTGIETHLRDVDKMINGMGHSNLIILAARPAMGKTALALNIAENVCFQGNKPIGFISLEMSAEQLMTRMICSQSGIASSKVQTGNLSGSEMQSILECVTKIQSRPFIIEDAPDMTIHDLRGRARRMHETYGIQFLVIDYLQLIKGSSRQSDNRQGEISEISRSLKQLARELNIPILCLSQLSRKVEERPGHRPMLSDLRESGSIEQDADVVCFLLRKEYYDSSSSPGGAELIIAKNRHGGIGDIPLRFHNEISRFDNQ
jgi:replicative DNA helicase